jgi:hypothetical protein
MGEVAYLKEYQQHSKALELVKSAGGLATINEQKLAKIEAMLPAVDRENHTAGRGNTQTTNQLMTLTMMSDSPYRRIRQCLAQIESKRSAIEETAFSLKKEQIKIKRLRATNDELDAVEADELEHKLYRSRDYIDAAYKELAVFLETKQEIQEAHNIPDDWDERDAELAEIDNHIKMAFRQAHRDMMNTGRIGLGNMEYLEQFGIHPQTAQRIIANYIQEEEKMIDEGQMPTVNRLYSFLDKMAETFHNAHEDVLNRIGIKELIKDEYLYLENK